MQHQLNLLAACRCVRWLRVVMIVRSLRRGVVLMSLVLVAMVMKALLPNFIVSSRNDQQDVPSSESFKNASQHSRESSQDNQLSSIKHPLIQHNNETDLCAPHNSVDCSNSSVKEVQSRRRQRVDDACHRLNVTNLTTTELKQLILARQSRTLFVDDGLRYIYCLVPKVASTSWTRVLLVASGKVQQKNPNDIPEHAASRYRSRGKKLPWLPRYSSEEIAYRLQNYFKFMFVRHPLQRLVSAFRDRLHGHRFTSGSLSGMILKYLALHHPANQSTNTQQKRGNRNVTFPEFVRYIIDPDNVPAKVNWHWRPHYDLCHPCHIRYDFIGHYETLHRDADAVLAAIGATDRAQFPKTDRDNRRKRNTSELVADMYKGLPTEHVHLLKTRVYGNDFMLFDFD